MIHQHICWVPRQWLVLPWNSLQIVIRQEMIIHYYKYRGIEGTTIRIECINACIRCHAQQFWMCKDGHDKYEAPHFKEYYALFIPCFYCTDL